MLVHFYSCGGLVVHARRTGSAACTVVSDVWCTVVSDVWNGTAHRVSRVCNSRTQIPARKTYPLNPRTYPRARQWSPPPSDGHASRSSLEDPHEHEAAPCTLTTLAFERRGTRTRAFTQTSRAPPASSQRTSGGCTPHTQVVAPHALLVACLSRPSHAYAYAHAHMLAPACSCPHAF